MDDYYDQNSSSELGVETPVDSASLSMETEVPYDTPSPTQMRRVRRPMLPHMQVLLNQSGHILDMLKAAMPYIDSRRQNTVETLMKATDLIHTTQNHHSSGQLSAASLDARPADMEGLLNSVRTVSSFQERDMIDKMLNSIKAKKLYETYMMFNQNRDPMRHSNTGNQSNHGFSSNSNIMETFKSILPPEQASALDQMSSVMNAMNVFNAMGNSNPMNNNYSMNNNNPMSNNYPKNYSNTIDSSTPMNDTYPMSNSYTMNDIISAFGNMSNKMSQQTDSHVMNVPDTYNVQAADLEQSVDHFASIPNYTYQMSSNPTPEKSTEINNDYLNQFVPKQETSPSPSLGSISMDQLYQSVQNIYQMLSQAGLAGSNSTQNQQNDNTTDKNTYTPIPSSSNDQTYPKAVYPNNVRSMPIPNARQFHPSQNRSRSHTSMEKNMEQVTLEAASLDPK